MSTGSRRPDARRTHVSHVYRILPFDSFHHLEAFFGSEHVEHSSYAHHQRLLERVFVSNVNV
jgi:hypothetical protein